MLAMKSTGNGEYYATLSQFLFSETFWNMTEKRVETSPLYEEYIKQGILRNFLSPFLPSVIFSNMT